MMRLIALGLAALSLAMVLCGTIIPRFWHSSKDASNGCKVDVGMGVANYNYKIECSGTTIEEWETSLDDSCDYESAAAAPTPAPTSLRRSTDRRSNESKNLKSCCEGRKAGFAVFVIGMVIQAVQILCFLMKPDKLLGGFPFTLTISTAVLIFYALAWLVVLGTCSEQLHTLSAWYNVALNQLIGSTDISYVNFKLEGSFVLYMLAYGCCLGAFALNWCYFDDDEVKGENVQEPTEATAVEDQPLATAVEDQPQPAADKEVNVQAQEAEVADQM